MAEGRLGAFVSDEPFREASTPEGYLEVVRDVAGPLRPRLLGSEPARATACPAEIRGFCEISNGARIGAAACIEDSIVLEGAEITPGAVVRRSILGLGARIDRLADRILSAAGESRPLALPSAEQEKAILGFLEAVSAAPPPAGSTTTAARLPDEHAPFAVPLTGGTTTTARGPDGQASGAPPPPAGRTTTTRNPDEKGLGVASPAVRPSIRRLHGDGSARGIFRIAFERETRVIVTAERGTLDASVYPRLGGAAAPNESESFVYVRNYLASLGAPVPRIDAADTAAGLILQEDLGNTRLYDLEHDGRPPEELRSRYVEAISALARMQSAGPVPFEPGRTDNLPYDLAFILKFESGYFHREMARGPCRLPIPFEELEETYARAARAALDGPVVFMHRDYQSRNLMIAPRGLVVIDFQGARLGPPEYDVASLLLDPYADVGDALERELLDEYQHRRPSGLAVDLGRRYRAVAVNRLLQALGAFGYLGGRLGKPGYLPHAPAALRRVRKLAAAEYPALAELADRCLDALPSALA